MSGFAQATQSNIKPLAYADDFLIFFKDTSEWATVKSLFELYSQASNSKVNLQKTYLVSLSGEPYEEWNVLCNTEQLEWHDKPKTTANRYLGFPLSSSKSQLEAFLADTLDKIRHTNILHARNLSIKGTSLVANSLLLSRLWHLLRVVTIPDKWLNQIRTLIHRFVIPFRPLHSWNTICQKRSRGGLNVVHVHHQQLALQLIYVQRLTREDTAQDFCTPIVRDLFQYYTGTIRWGNVGRNHGSIKQQMDQSEHIPAVAACFDQEKAYDRIHPEYLAKTLLHFGLPTSLVKTIHYLFFDTQISLSINGWLGAPFRQRRGLRQSDHSHPCFST